MWVCKYPKQLIAVFCAAFSMGHAWGAAPICSQVLSQSEFDLTEAQIKQYIDNLAELRMTYDSVQVRGESDLATTLVIENFPAKMAGISRLLSPRFSQTEVKEMLVQRIKQLQEADIAKEIKKQKTKTQEATGIKGYRLTKAVAMDLEPQFGFFAYDFATNKVIHVRDRKLIVADFDSGNEIVVQEMNKDVKYVEATHELLGFSWNGELIRYNLAEKKITLQKRIRDYKVEGIIEFSASGNQALVVEKHGGYLLDTLTGAIKSIPGFEEASAYTYGRLSLDSSKPEIKFVNENEALISFWGKEVIYRLDLTNLSWGEPYSTSPLNAYKMKISEDGSMLLWIGSDDYSGAIKVSDLNQFAKKSLKFSNEVAPNEFLGNSKGVTILNGDILSKKYTLDLYKYPNLKTKEKTLIEFDEGVYTRTVFAEASGGRISVKYTDSNSPNKVFVGIWELLSPDIKTSSEEK